MRKKILIIGTGAIGTLYGWVFTTAGHSVTHYVRAGKKKLLDKKKVFIKVTDKRKKSSSNTSKTYTYSVIETFESNHNYDIILAPVSHYQFVPLLPFLKEHAGEALIILFGNHWNDFDHIEKELKGRYIFGFPHHGASLGMNTLYGVLTPEISLSEPDNSRTERLQTTVAFFQNMGFQPKIPQDFKGWCLVHFAWNAAIIAEAIKQQGVYNYRKRFSAVRDSYLSMRETMNVVRARGVDPMTFQEGKMTATPLWLITPITMAMLFLPGIAETAQRHAENNPKELKSYYYDLVKTAKELHVAIPRFEQYKQYVDTLPDKLR